MQLISLRLCAIMMTSEVYVLDFDPAAYFAAAFTVVIL